MQVPLLVTGLNILTRSIALCNSLSHAAQSEQEGLRKSW